MAAVISGAFAATGQSAAGPILYTYNVSIRFANGVTGTVHVQRSFDGGATWETVRVIQDSDAVHSVVGMEPERGVLYRLDCVTKGGSAGNIDYRIGSDGLSA